MAMIDATNELASIYKAIELAGIYEARLAKLISPSNNSKATTIVFKAAIKLHENALAWNQGDRSFESWLEMAREYYLDKDVLAIDVSGELQSIALEYLGMLAGAAMAVVKSGNRLGGKS